MTRSRFLLAFPFVLAALVGCGEQGPKDAPKQATVPVNGIVKFNGKPLANASVNFIALDGKVSARGTTDGAGSYRLSTYGEQDGAPAGNYKVTIAVSGVTEIEPGVLAPEPAGGFKSPIPAKYARQNETPVTKEVPAAGGTINIDIN